MISFAAAAQVLGLASASGTRAALTLLVLAVGGWQGAITLPPELSFLATPAALGALAALAIVEQAMERDDGVRRLLKFVSSGTHGTAGALAGLVAMRVPGLEQVPPAALGALGAVLAIATQGLRAHAHDALSSIEQGLFSPRRWLTWLENGGAIGLAVATIFAPFLALGFVVAGFALTVGILVVARRLEARSRYPCPSCGRAIREEASICPKCRTALEPKAWRDLGFLHAAGVSAKAALNARTGQTR